ncbi:MAG TPA: FecR domain-containing protein [Dinghuibacter sp.]|uniref:FecR family protein n=1 Tax=Dinghuibacter sp. TaxID=2024697 RepID=UPI002C8F87B2|nr:FecR domain-containing protein [Dinghuibacter sp.]HTJ12951.1 FecR domain-containing protein [Dinghuibacter sp.]
MHEKDCWSLLENETFVHWVLHPNAISDRHWKAWVGNDQDRARTVAQARDILSRLQRSSSLTGRSALRREMITEDIWKSVQAEMQAEAVNRLFQSKARSPWWAVAATLTVLVVSAGLLWYAGQRSKSDNPVAPAIANLAPSGNSILTYNNTTGKPQRVYLVDGSVITLEPGSTLSYARFLSPMSREVTLEGNAFFDIARDARRPFLVHSGGLVTRVLGTSFRVIDNPEQEDEHVVVRTGKVSVYKQEDFDNGQPAFCVLLPHQEAVFHKKGNSLSFQSKADEQLIPPVEKTEPLVFDDIPVTDILQKLEERYHIHIQYNKESLSACRLTTSLEEETLDDKLSIICVAINASYHTEGDSIIVEGGHCAP